MFAEYANQIAAIIVEPVAANMGTVLPQKGFLEGLRKITEDNGALLIFDEVITGFRLSPGGAQQYYGVMPDITTLGKIIGGGLPVGAYGGKKSVMQQLAPVGPIYQAGTLSGNPLAMAAGLEMLKTLKNNPSIYEELERKAAKFEKGLKENLQKTGVKAVINRVGSLLTMFFTDLEKIESFEEVMKSDQVKYARYFSLALEAGIYLAPSQFEAAFISNAHSDEDIEKTIEASYQAMTKL